ncbi:MAG TPA: response regulator [Bacteroidales bacterium]|nr:response regulator [Bacteroidales bacterium]HOZ30759.1 response regulator [Bacteroidales bacterium]
MTKKYRILIADDDSLNYLYYKEILDNQIYDIIYVDNGLKAIETLKENPETIDLILMDMKMPDMDGFTATNEIRKFNLTIPIIAQTAYAYREDYEKAINAGCSDYISKPIREDILISKIEKLLKINNS